MQVYISQFVNVITLVIAFSMIIWGLKLFKYYVILLGIILGGLIGAGLGGIISRGDPSGAIAGAILGATGGGFIAWPLKKLFIFIIFGLVAGFFGAVLFGVMVGPSQGCIIIGIIFFIIGGVIAVKLFDIIIIIMMAFLAAQRIFYIFYGTLSSLGPPRSGRHYSRHIFSEITNEISRWWDSLIQYCSHYIIEFIIVILVFVLFALYLQKFKAIKRKDNSTIREEKKALKQIAISLGSIAVIGYILSILFPISNSSIGIWIMGLNIVSWPVITIAVYYLLVGYANYWRRRGVTTVSKSRIIFFALIVSLIVVPITAGIINFLYYIHKPVYSSRYFWRYNIFRFLARYYSFFLPVGPPFGVILMKWVYTFAIFPWIIIVWNVRDLLNVKREEAGKEITTIKDEKARVELPDQTPEKPEPEKYTPVPQAKEPEKKLPKEEPPPAPSVDVSAAPPTWESPEPVMEKKESIEFRTGAPERKAEPEKHSDERSHPQDDRSEKLKQKEDAVKDRLKRMEEEFKRKYKS